LRPLRLVLLALPLFLAACAEDERSPFDPNADIVAPSLVSLSIAAEGQAMYATWEASEPVRAVVEFENTGDGTISSAYSGSREFATSGVTKLVAVRSGTTYDNVRVRLRDRAGNEASGVPATAEFTTGTIADAPLFFFAMIDVGWGDSLYLEAPDGTNCLIDAGHPADGRVVRSFLTGQLGITALDFASMTHVHEDHIGGFYGDDFDNLAGLLATNADTTATGIFRIGTFLDILEKTPNSLNNPYSDLLSVITLAGANVGQRVLLGPGASSETEPALQWGEGLRVDLLAAGRKDFLLPDFILSAEPGSVQNNDSMVYRVQYGDFVILLMGDGEFATEQYLENTYPRELLKATILKLGHHGSNDANSERFLNVVDPVVGLIPNAVSENPGVEHPYVMNRLRDRGTDYFASDRVIANRDRAESGVRGDVLIYTDGGAFTVIADNIRYE
jgi:competence protein ComEC